MSRMDRVEELLKKKKMSFADIYKKLEKEKMVTQNDIGILYQDLSLDGRFFCTKNNMWDLKKKHKFSQTYVDLEKLYLDDEEESEENEDEEELTISELEEE